MEIKGKVIEVLPMEGGTSKNGNEWKKASLIVEVAENPQYPKKVKLHNMKKAELFSKLGVGEEGTFKVEIESREFNGRWYTEVSCWGWDMTKSAAAVEPAETSGNPPEPAAGAEDDGLPF